ncbi:MAG: BTAD domain-containing putative transcriptional regulator [Fimbriimonas sp.]|nr:BTAD domain-containing putative transcriptional regulator [Fimbriimonas sp.]
MSTEDTIHASSPAPLSIRLFGPIEIQVQGDPLPRLRSRKGLWLLALLTLKKGQPVERNWLAGALWPDSSQSQALAYLRHCLTELRHALGPEAARLQSPTHQTLCLRLEGANVDVLTFDASIQLGDPAALQSAAAVYRGPLLNDCTEEWAPLERGNREESYLAALRDLADDAIARGDAATAVGYARRAIEVDPLQEGAQRTLIQALVLVGDFGAAVQVYRDLRLHLHRELSIEPDPQTTALFNRLRAETRQKAPAKSGVTPSRSASSPPRRLPRPLTDLLGRDDEVVQVAARLRQRRLVTLTGTGGLGKTRVAIAVAEALLEEFGDGAWFVELAGISDAKLVVQAVATTFGVRDESGRSLHESLLSFLRPKVLLLVLDNCEHLLRACATLAADLLDDCSGVRILATSRQALGITGEVNWPLPMLPVPDLAHLPTEEEALLAKLSQVASVQLFVERAEAMQKSFALTARNALPVARICERLDGIPLAIELAAGNVKFSPIEPIASSLDDVFRLLKRGSRTALPRQQTLQATLDWSYDLLTETERILLQRLSVFADGWTLEGCEQVCISCPDETPPAIRHVDLFDTLTSLVDKSLVQVSVGEDFLRYRMLETVRQYARDRLAETGESGAVRTRHRDAFMALAADAEPNFQGPDQAAWFKRMDAEHENLRAALEWSLSGREPEVSLSLCGKLMRFWTTRGRLSEGREWCWRALNQPGSQRATRERADALNAAGNVAMSQGDYPFANAQFEESLTIRREIGDWEGFSCSLNNLGIVAVFEGRQNAAREYYEESLVIRRATDDKHGIASTLCNLGCVAMDQGDFNAARAHLEESRALTIEIGSRFTGAQSVGNLGLLCALEGDYVGARAHYNESLLIHQEIGHRQAVAEDLELLFSLAVKENHAAHGAELWGMAKALREQIGCPLTPQDQQSYDADLVEACKALGDAGFSAAFEKGRALSLERAIELALEGPYA